MNRVYVHEVSEVKLGGIEKRAAGYHLDIVTKSEYGVNTVMSFQSSNQSPLEDFLGEAIERARDAGYREGLKASGTRTEAEVDAAFDRGISVGLYKVKAALDREDAVYAEAYDKGYIMGAQDSRQSSYTTEPFFSGEELDMLRNSVRSSLAYYDQEVEASEQGYFDQSAKVCRRLLKLIREIEEEE